MVRKQRVSQETLYKSAGMRDVIRPPVLAEEERCDIGDGGVVPCRDIVLEEMKEGERGEEEGGAPEGRGEGGEEDGR